MTEKERLRELHDYDILDSPDDKELEDLAEIASAICDTPISLVSLVDEERQWFKVSQGLKLKQTPRAYSFCQHSLEKPGEVLVIDDPLNDPRFSSNPLVLEEPGIRFYAGAPLVSPRGFVLGTLCVIDKKVRSISGKQKKALQLLAARVMNHFESRRLIRQRDKELDQTTSRLQKLSDHAPGAVYQLERHPQGDLKFRFISKGFLDIHPALDVAQLKEDASLAFDVVHPDDLPGLRKSLEDSYQNLTEWNREYRVISGDKISWHWVNAIPELEQDGKVVWYGTFQVVTDQKEYVRALEQILFDISHVMRRPAATLLGLTSIIEENDLEPDVLQEYLVQVRQVTKELDGFIRKLNSDYSEIRSNIKKSVISPEFQKNDHLKLSGK